jgi:hypothetical protein
MGASETPKAPEDQPRLARRDRPTRRDLLAGFIGGAAAVAAEAGLDALRGGGGTSGGATVPPGSLAGLPVEIGKAVPELPAGLVRTDLRAFLKGSGSDTWQAFADALDASDVVYVPPGTWLTTRTIEVAAGKLLWSDAGFDREVVPYKGAIIRAQGSMPATVSLTGLEATLYGVNVDGANVADAALEFASESVHLNQVTAKRGVSYALKATGDFCTIWGGLFQQDRNTGYAMYQEGSDLLMWGSRIKRGDIPLWMAGSGCTVGVLHVTGMGDPAGSSSASVKVSGPRNDFVDVYYDTAAGPSLLLSDSANGNRFVGMLIRSAYTGGSFPAIRCDARNGPVTNNLFEAFNTDPGRGAGWTFLLEMLGDPEMLAGNVLGDGHANGCANLWNVRPAVVGDIVTGGALTRNAGSVQAGQGNTLLIPHGLAGIPRSVGVDLSSGSAPRPDIGLDATNLTLTWPSPPGTLTVYWRAEL